MALPVEVKLAINDEAANAPVLNPVLDDDLHVGGAYQNEGTSGPTH
jgi:hypothetical protein